MKIPEYRRERVSAAQLREDFIDVSAELGSELARQGDLHRLETLIALYSASCHILAQLREVSR